MTVPIRLLPCIIIIITVKWLLYYLGNWNSNVPEGLKGVLVSVFTLTTKERALKEAHEALGHRRVICFHQLFPHGLAWLFSTAQNKSGLVQ